jgi:phosphonoacetate hydrolase
MTAIVPVTARERDRALEVLLSRDLEPIVDMVAWSTAADAYEVASAEGAVRFHRERTMDGGFVVDSVAGRNPLVAQDQARFAGLDAERATPHPNRSLNSYPNAFEQFAQVFDHQSAPDLCVIHSAAHNWADQGGHLGEHGSLGVVQARAPFVIAGAGAPRLGMIDIGCRLIDVAPTALQLLGTSSNADTLLSHQEGSSIEVLVKEAGRARHLIGFLWDGHQPKRALRPCSPGFRSERRAPHRRRYGLSIRCAGLAPNRDACQPHHYPHREPPGSSWNPSQRLDRPA